MNAHPKLARPTCLVLMCALAGSCTLFGNGSSDPFRGESDPERGEFTLWIDNGHGEDIRVGVVWGTTVRPLGMIRAGEGENFRLAREDDVFRLAVESLEGGAYDTAPTPVRVGQFVRVRLPPR
jgi:hypothetical protein